MFPGWPAWAIALVVIVTATCLILLPYALRQMYRDSERRYRRYR